MQVIKKIGEMKRFSDELRGQGKTISFVPTMGALHEGHLSLMRKGREIGNVLVVSIFVNEIQFAAGEDFTRYPRDLEGDMGKMKEVGVDIVFAPAREDMYPTRFQTYVEVKALEAYLCGSHRAGHFRGVATVVLKLFNIVKPTFAFFGEKDYQQLKIIQKMVEDLNLDVEIIGMPLVRGKDGLALSSRNSYLSPIERKIAPSIPEALTEIKRKFERGYRDAKGLTELGKRILLKVGITSIDYVEICDPETLEGKETAESGDLVAVAVRVGNTRLIDNIRL